MSQTKELWLKENTPSSFVVAFVTQNTVGKKVLDVGCAQGWYAEELQKRGFEVTASDIEKDIIYDDLNFIKADVTKLPFNQNEFDTTLAISVLEHVENYAKALQELNRVTSKRLLLITPNKDDHALKDYNLTFRHFTDRGHKNFYNQEELTKLLEKYGFKIVKAFTFGPVLPSVLSEFIGNKMLRVVARKVLNRLFTWKILNSPELQADIFIVADKK